MSRKQVRPPEDAVRAAKQALERTRGMRRETEAALTAAPETPEGQPVALGVVPAGLDDLAREDWIERLSPVSFVFLQAAGPGAWEEVYVSPGDAAGFRFSQHRHGENATLLGRALEGQREFIEKAAIEYEPAVLLAPALGLIALWMRTDDSEQHKIVVVQSGLVEAYLSLQTLWPARDFARRLAEAIAAFPQVDVGPRND
ncbi:MAG: hypothetical protein HY235_30125 [Acidobacteria bacterium]|nr:hypothetical protein [Acidobacteriota bacterium]